MKLEKPFALRHALVTALAVAFVTALAGGCSRQSEGDRCSLTNGNQDCDDGLVCTPSDELQQGTVDRCCPAEGQGFSDSRCTPRSGNAGTGGSGTGGGTQTGGASNQGGQGGAGTGMINSACSYNSDCSEGLVCGPSGKCQSECRTNVDCPADRPTCNAQLRCVM